VEGEQPHGCCEGGTIIMVTVTNLVYPLSLEDTNNDLFHRAYMRFKIGQFSTWMASGGCALHHDADGTTLLMHYQAPNCMTFLNFLSGSIRTKL
jgi:hypothetical protein